jgi:hypothetical protein
LVAAAAEQGETTMIVPQVAAAADWLGATTYL